MPTPTQPLTQRYSLAHPDTLTSAPPPLPRPPINTHTHCAWYRVQVSPKQGFVVGSVITTS
eukprot:56211-Eustigmatos_ZCMA.PRE.1